MRLRRCGMARGHAGLPKKTDVVLSKAALLATLRAIDEDAESKNRVLELEKKFRSKFTTAISALPGKSAKFGKFRTNPFVLMLHCVERCYSRIQELEKDIRVAKQFSSMETSAGKAVEAQRATSPSDACEAALLALVDTPPPVALGTGAGVPRARVESRVRREADAAAGVDGKGDLLPDAFPLASQALEDGGAGLRLELVGAGGAFHSSGVHADHGFAAFHSSRARAASLARWRFPARRASSVVHENPQAQHVIVRPHQPPSATTMRRRVRQDGHRSTTR